VQKLAKWATKNDYYENEYAAQARKQGRKHIYHFYFIFYEYIGYKIYYTIYILVFTIKFVKIHKKHLIYYISSQIIDIGFDIFHIFCSKQIIHKIIYKKIFLFVIMCLVI
jgi:hypothetical protein